MGKHTAYWRAYSRAQVRGTLRIFAAIAIWTVIAGVLASVHDALGGFFPWLMGGVFLGLAVTLVLLGKNAYRVVCPECGTPYTRSKWGGSCPSCGLKLLQNEP